MLLQQIWTSRTVYRHCCNEGAGTQHLSMPTVTQTFAHLYGSHEETAAHTMKQVHSLQANYLFLRKATIGTESFTVERLSLPPAAHFLRGSGLVITNVHATTLQGPNTQRGEWVAAERVVAQASALLQ